MNMHRRGNLYASTSHRKNDKPLSPWVTKCSCGDEQEHRNAQEAFYYQSNHAMQHSGVVEVTTTIEA